MTDKTSENQENKNEKVESRKEENEDDDYKYENEDEDEDYENKNEYEYENETMSQDKITKNLNNSLDRIIDKSFEEQIESLKKLEDLKEYWFIKDFDDKELKFKIFKLKLADMSNEIEEELFEQIFGHTLIKLANKLITTDKEENQVIVKNIEKNKDKLFKEDEFYNFVIQPQKRSYLKYTIDLILDFNETIQLDLV